MGQKLTTKDALLRFRVVHGDKYDYSETVYQGSLSHIRVRCPEHGYFSIIANNHRLGFGCAACAKQKKVQEIFDSFSRVHNGYYDYSISKYIGIDKKIKIICPVHGVFERLPVSHLKGSGCLVCQGKVCDTESLLVAFNKAHGDTYDYSEAEYVKSNEKVKIICRKHGAFYQNIYKHLDYQGCPKCSGRIKKTNSQAIEEFEGVYGKRFDYSLMNYNGNNKEVSIICREHGIFRQTPKSHIKRVGCKACLMEGKPR